MKIKLRNYENHYWDYYNVKKYYIYKQEQYEYMHKYLNMDTLYKGRYIIFANEEIAEWFHKTYGEYYWLDGIYKNSPDGYQWLKNHWCKGIFWFGFIHSTDKQELKTIVNKVINITLRRNKCED